MSLFSIVHSFGSDELNFASGITDLELCQIDNQWILYTYSTETGSLTALSLERNKVASLLDQNSNPWNGTTVGYTDITIIDMPQTALILPESSLFETVSAQQLDASGLFQSTSASPALPDSLEHVLAMSIASENGTYFLYSSNSDTGKINGYIINDDLTFDALSLDIPLLQTPTTLLKTGRDGDLLYLFAAGSDTPEITTYVVAEDGTLDFFGALSAEDGLWANTLTTLEVVKMDGNLFLFAGASGSSSITVIKQKNSGTLEVVDHVFDTLNTRYNDLSSMELVRKKGHTYLFTAGSDDGITVYEVTSDGRMFYMESLVDTSETGLGNITDLGAVKIGGDIQIFATGQDGVLTQIDFNPGDIRQPKRGDNTDNVIKGNKKDDLLLGRGGDDKITGGKGNDRLVDGYGKDRLKGGSDADSFVLIQDGRSDTIVDFDPKEDLIDLSDVTFLYRFEDLSIKEKSWGIKIKYNDEVLRLLTSDPDMINDITEDVFLFA
ncbi:MAG: hypothetical protein ABJO67_17445 [Pseudoruegeria sp.]